MIISLQDFYWTTEGTSSGGGAYQTGTLTETAKLKCNKLASSNVRKLKS